MYLYIDLLQDPPPASSSTPWLVTLLAPTLAVIVGAVIGTWYLGRRNEKWELRQQTEFRASLVADMARVAHDLRFEAKIHRRRVENKQFKDRAEQDKSKTALDGTYKKLRAEGAAIEVRIQAHFANAEIRRGWRIWRNKRGVDGDKLEVRRRWHAAMDFATVMYWAAIQEDRDRRGKLVAAPDEIRNANSGKDHTGWCEFKLKNFDRVDKGLCEALADAAGFVVDKELVVPKD